ncbi:hypothetical protein ALC56_12270 [Trachymyrmex septentrionalis]|uniref:Uncharacterized protein n=1 Tax=Trachymyrmex septentrionalis TaxID=34720 RepID=A0A195EZB3_9HYME|nr:hypothetical protein ALC56_12270 [Trachymyrmex septentrionalis]
MSTNHRNPNSHELLIQPGTFTMLSRTNGQSVRRVPTHLNRPLLPLGGGDRRLNIPYSLPREKPVSRMDPIPRGGIGGIGSRLGGRGGIVIGGKSSPHMVEPMSLGPVIPVEIPGVLEAASVVVAFIILYKIRYFHIAIIYAIIDNMNDSNVYAHTLCMRPPPMSRSRRNGGGGGGGYGSRPNIRSLYPFLSGPPPIPPLGHSFDQ